MLCAQVACFEMNIKNSFENNKMCEGQFMHTELFVFLTFWEKASLSSSLLPDSTEFHFIVHIIYFEIKYCFNYFLFYSILSHNLGMSSGHHR